MKNLHKTLLIAVLIFAGISFNSCEKDDNTPPWIMEKVEQLGSGLCDTDAHVDEYEFQDDTVYVFEPGSCGADMPAYVYNEDGIELGFLGGIMGNQTINGESFDNATFIRTVWER